jgi:hypothetical protein
MANILKVRGSGTAYQIKMLGIESTINYYEVGEVNENKN